MDVYLKVPDVHPRMVRGALMNEGATIEEESITAIAG